MEPLVRCINEFVRRHVPHLSYTSIALVHGAGTSPRNLHTTPMILEAVFFPKFISMHFQNGDIKLYTVVLLFLCFLKILTK